MEMINRTRERRGQGGGGNDSADSPGMVTVSTGLLTEDLPIAGMSVAEVRARFGSDHRLDIDPASVATIDGEIVRRVDEQAVRVRPNAVLGFIRASGEKGSLLGVRSNKRGLDVPIFDYMSAYKNLKDQQDVASRVSANGHALLGATGSRIVIEDSRLEVATPEGARIETTVAATFAGWRRAPRASLDGLVLPDGVLGTWSRGSVCVVARQHPAGLHSVNWWVGGEAYGSGAKYERFTIALPYMIILAAFTLDGSGFLNINRKKVECFVSNSPLKTPDDKVFPCPLLNVTRFASAESSVVALKPISWLCTQYLGEQQLRSIPNPNERLRQTFRELRHVAYETNFNFSSENQADDGEGDSWYSTHVRQGARRTRAAISDIHEWQRLSKTDPAFVLDLEWLDVNMTLGTVADRLLRICNAPEPPPLDCSEDIARLASVASARTRVASSTASKHLQTGAL